MQELKTLIDKASFVCGSDTQLALRLGVYQPDVANMRAGTRKISPMTAAELADIAGTSVEDAVMLAVLESSIGTRREGAILSILGNGIRSSLTAVQNLSSMTSPSKSNYSRQTRNHRSIDA